ncbi:MAG: amidohydrolase family protein [Butyricicoccus pullicaecorum]|uniref:amidohydrolase family protein n=1 Tax=Butyricicoccus pullicaecorum TaxID=501571 RepID=UPI002A7A20EB|nr:amidohydrolase family protein [Butyricicoccus pullicaecorum]
MKQIITARTVLAGSELEEIQNGAVVVEDGKVVKVVPAEQLTEEDRAQAECIAFEDETVLPGLIEGHNHLSIDARKSNHLEILGTATECKLTLLAEEGLYDDLLSGVTTVRCMGEKHDLDLKLKKEIDAGNLVGPDILPAGVGMKGSNGSGYIGAPHSGVEEFRRTARSNVAKGVKLLKIFTTPGVFSTEQDFIPSFLSAEEIRTVVEEAHRLHLPVAAHCIGGQALRDCVEQGVDVIEHAYCASKEDIELLKAHPDCWVDLTTGIYLDPDREQYLSENNARNVRAGREIVRECVGNLVRAGIHFALGTDANHGLLWKEVVYTVELGASKRDALKGVTSNAAYISRLSGKKGELTAGADADIIAVKGNPLEDPAVLADVSFVMKKGVVYKKNGAPTACCRSIQKTL